MTFQIPDRWVWDCWIADDGDRFHLFYLNAPRSLGDPDLRHRHAVVGHATSSDLREWTDHGIVVRPGATGDFDETATWTGSVTVHGTQWWMFFTGSRFLHPVEHRNIETIGQAVSADLHTWVKRAGAVVRADPRWYETLPDATWHEEAWRDPWVFRGHDRWHMLVTARARHIAEETDPRDGGVVGHATSLDLERWTVHEPLSAPGTGFAHLEVIQPFTIGERSFILFSCDRSHLAGARATNVVGGIWVAPQDGTTGWCSVEQARLLVDESLYAARVVRQRDGSLALIGFENHAATGDFGGRISDPIPLSLGDDGWPVLAEVQEGTR